MPEESQREVLPLKTLHKAAPAVQFGVQITVFVANTIQTEEFSRKKLFYLHSRFQTNRIGISVRWEDSLETFQRKGLLKVLF